MHGLQYVRLLCCCGAHARQRNAKTTLADALRPQVHKASRSLAKKKKPGPDNSRNEHWHLLAKNERVVTHLTTITCIIQHGETPPQVLNAILATDARAKVKPNGKLRLLGVPTALRRIAARA